MNDQLIQDGSNISSQWKHLAEGAAVWKDELSKSLGIHAVTDAISFVNCASGDSSTSHYKHFGNEARSILSRIHQTENADTVRLFLKLVIAQAMHMTIEKRIQNHLPEVLNSNQLFHFTRMQIGKDLDDTWLDIDADLFQKEFGLASERLFASGSQLLDRHCGVPRSIIFNEGLGKAPAKIAFFTKIAGFKPMIQIHTHKFNLDKFNEAGWDECYKGCVELYQIFPKLLGVFGSSWFYDPAIVKISPRLQYLQSKPSDGGAKFYYYSTGGSSIANATSTSESRRKLYEDGKYDPKDYMMIWGKESQTAWSNTNLKSY